MSVEAYQLFREHFGEPDHSVYPGHPITVAWIITQVFRTYEEAFRTEEGNQYSNALGSSKIPGAGDNVHQAMSILHMLREGSTFEEAVERASLYWDRCDDQKNRNPGRWEEGQKQADKVKPLLKAAEEWWKQP